MNRIIFGDVALRARIHHIIKKIKWNIVDHIIVTWFVGLLSLVPDLPTSKEVNCFRWFLKFGVVMNHRVT